MKIYTVGYQHVTPDELIEALQRHGIGTVIDVRSRPVSRKPGFGRKQIEQALQQAGITYDWVPELGGKDAVEPAARSHAIDALASRVLFGEVVCLLCMEADPEKCHRKQVAKELAAACDASIVHIDPSCSGCLSRTKPPYYPCENHPDREAFVRTFDERLLCRDCYLQKKP